MLKNRRCFVVLMMMLAVMGTSPYTFAKTLVYQGSEGQGAEGPGKGKHIVFVAAEEAYRSELSMALMARILSQQGFKCTVLFAIDPATGKIDQRVKDNIPGLAALNDADLLVAFMRWRELPDDQMKYIVDYADSGRPIIGIRNATHPFRYSKDSNSPYAKYDWASQDPAGGWGRMVFGETWVTHYGKNLVESTRCDAVAAMNQHPIFHGVRRSFWLPDDVYGISDELHGDCQPLLVGQPLTGWSADSEVNHEKAPVPIAWTKSFTGKSGKKARVFTSTMGHGDAFKIEDFRRLIANACYWCMGLESQIDPVADMSIRGRYDPGPAGVKGLQVGLTTDSPLFKDSPPAKNNESQIRATIDDSQPGWRSLTETDFTKVNSADETWQWKNGVLHCTGQPISVIRTSKQFTNFELVVEWMHEKPAGNSGVFAWVTPASVKKLTESGKPGLPDGIEIQILDHAFTDRMKERGRSTDWFGTNGDVFAVGVSMTPFPPLSPNGSRSFPRLHRAKGHGNWNHYYVRAINGEVRLWVNGEEVSGGTNCDPATGYLCLESEGSPIQFRKIRIRELP